MNATVKSVGDLIAQRLQERPEATWLQSEGFTAAIIGNGRRFVEIGYTSPTKFGLASVGGPSEPTTYLSVEKGQLISAGGAPEPMLDVLEKGWHFYRPNRQYGYVQNDVVAAIVWAEVQDDQSEGKYTRTLATFQFVAQGVAMPEALRLTNNDSRAWMDRFWAARKTGAIIDLTERLAGKHYWIGSDGQTRAWLQLDHNTSPTLHRVYELRRPQDARLDTTCPQQWGKGTWQRTFI